MQSLHLRETSQYVSFSTKPSYNTSPSDTWLWPFRCISLFLWQQRELGRTLRTVGWEKKMQSSCPQKRFWDIRANTALPKGLVHESATNVKWADEDCRVHENFWWSSTQECYRLLCVHGAICHFTCLGLFVIMCYTSLRPVASSLFPLLSQSHCFMNENWGLWQEC